MTPITDHSQLTFVNVLTEADRDFHPKKSNDLFNSRIYYRTSAADVEHKTLIIYIGDFVCKKFGLPVGGRASIVRIPDHPYRIGLKLDDNGIKSTARRVTSDKDEADQQGGFHDLQLQVTLDGLKVPYTKGKRIEPTDWQIIDQPDGDVLLIDLPADSIYIDHLIETDKKAESHEGNRHN